MFICYLIVQLICFDILYFVVKVEKLSWYKIRIVTHALNITKLKWKHIFKSYSKITNIWALWQITYIYWIIYLYNNDKTETNNIYKTFTKLIRFPLKLSSLILLLLTLMWLFTFNRMKLVNLVQSLGLLSYLQTQVLRSVKEEKGRLPTSPYTIFRLKD